MFSLGFKTLEHLLFKDKHQNIAAKMSTGHVCLFNKKTNLSNFINANSSTNPRLPRFHNLYLMHLNSQTNKSN